MSDELPDISEKDARLIALEVAYQAAVQLDQMRMAMLQEAVEWLAEVTELDEDDIRRQLAFQKGTQVGRNIATLKAVKQLLHEQIAPQK